MGLRRSMLTANFSNVVTKAVATSQSNIMTVPASVVAGDLLLLYVGNFASAPGYPSGWTLVGNSAGGGTYQEWSSVSYKIAAGTEGGTNISYSTASSYVGAILLVITGHNASNPIHANTSVGTSVDSTSLSTAALTTTVPARRYLFWGAMTNNGTMPTMSVSPTGPTLNADVQASGGSYHRVNGWQTGMEGAGSHTQYTMTLNNVASMHAWDIAIAAA